MPIMRTRITGTLLVATLVLAACGGSDDDGGGLTSDQTKAVANFIEVTKPRDETAYEACVAEVGSQLSDDDASILTDATGELREPVSAAGEALIERLADCVS
jgi:hypothetical protein